MENTKTVQHVLLSILLNYQQKHLTKRNVKCDTHCRKVS
jgi:hypothetical protein